MTSTRQLLSFCATLTALAALTSNARAQRLLAETFGDQALARYGAAIATIADIDGDGVRDLVIGEPGRDYSASAGVIESGAVVLRGSRTGILRSRNLGLQTFGFFGSSVAALGDVDGDGVPDWAAGSAAMGTSRAGYARIMSGANGVTLWDVYGEASSELGTSIAGVGDLDADGRADVAISSPHNSSVHPYGTVRCYVGNTGTYLHQYAGLSQDSTGKCIAAIGDVDHDGQTELAVGEPDFSFGGAGSGHVYLFNPRRAAASGIVWESFVPFQSGWHGGIVVAAAGDVNGDGVPDVLVGTSVGRVVILSGANGSELRWHQSGDAGYGASMSGIGDFDGDGRDDYAIGAPQVNGGNGRVTVYSGASGAVLLTLDGTPGSAFGSALAGIGDFDGDGRADFVVGAPNHLVNGQLMGRVAIFGLAIPAIMDTFGTGCAGARGLPFIYMGGQARPGMSFDTRCGNVPDNAVGFWLTGWSNTTANNVPLPLDLSTFGFTGCQLLVSPDETLLFLNGLSSYVRRTWNLPSLPSLAGMTIYTQAAILDATRAGGMSFSDGGHIRIGNL
jgi:hypothetical protein